MMTSYLISAYGVFVGLAAISLATWSLIVHRNHWDSNHVTAMFTIGSILLVVYSRWTEFENPIFALVNALLITLVLHWMVIIATNLYREDPVRELMNDSE